MLFLIKFSGFFLANHSITNQFINNKINNPFWLQFQQKQIEIDQGIICRKKDKNKEKNHFIAIVKKKKRTLPYTQGTLYRLSRSIR